MKPYQHKDGVSLVPLLKGNRVFARGAIYFHYPHYGGKGDSPAGAIRKGDYKLIWFYEDDHIEKVVLKDEFVPVNFYLLPFVKPSMVKMIVGTDENGNNLSYNETIHRLIERENIDQTQRNILVSHLFYLPSGKNPEDVDRMDSEIRTIGNIDQVSADILENFDYAALGHIHKPMKVGSETLRYCGTPMPYSLSEGNQQKGILMVEMGAKGDVQTTVLPLHPVHQVRKLRATREALLSGASEDFVSICVTDAEAAEMVGLRELLRAKYPNLLELRREEKETVELEALQERAETLSPYELCLQFAGERLNAEEKALLTEVMNAMKEENA